MRALRALAESTERPLDEYTSWRGSRHDQGYNLEVSTLANQLHRFLWRLGPAARRRRISLLASGGIWTTTRAAWHPDTSPCAQYPDSQRHHGHGARHHGGGNASGDERIQDTCGCSDTRFRWRKRDFRDWNITEATQLKAVSMTAQAMFDEETYRIPIRLALFFFLAAPKRRVFFEALKGRDIGTGSMASPARRSPSLQRVYALRQPFRKFESA
jgi:hypothetical protein